MKEDCFGFKNRKCTVLVDGVKCDGCTFYRTKAQASQDRADVEESIERRGLKRVYARNEEGEPIVTLVKKKAVKR